MTAPFGFNETELRVIARTSEVWFPKDTHREAAAKMFNVAVEDVTKEQRQAAKQQAYFDLYFREGPK